MESYIDYRVWFRTRSYAVCKSCDVEILQDCGGVFNSGGKENCSVGAKKRYIYSSFCDFLLQLVKYDNVDSYPAFCRLTNTQRPCLHLAQWPGTTWMRICKTRFRTGGEERWWYQGMLLNFESRSLLSSGAPLSKLSNCQVVPTVQPSNAPTNTLSCAKSTWNWCHRMNNTSLFTFQCFNLCERGIISRKPKIYWIDSWKYCAMNQSKTIITTPRRQTHPSSGANRPSDVAVTVNINAEYNLSLICSQLTP